MRLIPLIFFLLPAVVLGLSQDVSQASRVSLAESGVLNGKASDGAPGSEFRVTVSDTDGSKQAAFRSVDISNDNAEGIDTGNSGYVRHGSFPEEQFSSSIRTKATTEQEETESSGVVIRSNNKQQSIFGLFIFGLALLLS